jgi:hypothetical protein
MEWTCGMNVETKDFDCEILWKKPVFGNVSHGQDYIKTDVGK